MKSPPLSFALAASLALLGGCPAKEAPTAEASMALAIQAHLAGNTAEAIRHYRDTVRRNPDHAAAHFDLALLLQDNGEDPSEAYYHFRTYIELQPQTQRAPIALERMRRAEEDIEKIVSARTRHLSTNTIDVLQRQLDALSETLQEKEKALADAQSAAAALSKQNEQLTKDAAQLNKRLQLLLDVPVVTENEEMKK